MLWNDLSARQVSIWRGNEIVHLGSHLDLRKSFGPLGQVLTNGITGRWEFGKLVQKASFREADLSGLGALIVPSSRWHCALNRFVLFRRLRVHWRISLFSGNSSLDICA